MERRGGERGGGSQLAMICAAPAAPSRLCAAWTHAYPQAWAPSQRTLCRAECSSSKSGGRDSRRRRQAVAVQGPRGLGPAAEAPRRGASVARRSGRAPDETEREAPSAAQHQGPASSSSGDSAAREESSGTEEAARARGAAAPDAAPGQDSGASPGPPDSGTGSGLGPGGQSAPSGLPPTPGRPTAQFQSFQVRDLLLPEKVDASDVKTFRKKLCGYSSFFVTGESVPHLLRPLPGLPSQLPRYPLPPAGIRASLRASLVASHGHWRDAPMELGRRPLDDP